MHHQHSPLQAKTRPKTRAMWWQYHPRIQSIQHHPVSSLEVTTNKTTPRRMRKVSIACSTRSSWKVFEVMSNLLEAELIRCPKLSSNYLIWNRASGFRKLVIVELMFDYQNEERMKPCCLLLLSNEHLLNLHSMLNQQVHFGVQN